MPNNYKIIYTLHCLNDEVTFKSEALLRSVNVISSTLLYVQFHICPIFKWPIFTHQLTELHNQQEGDALTALPQTLKDVGMFKAPEVERKTR